MARKTDLQRVTGRFMQQLYEDEQERQWADKDMMMIRRLGEYSSQVFSSGQPFQTTRLHIGIVTEGTVDMTVNLLPCHLTEQSLLVVTPESIMQMAGRTAKLDMQVVHISDELIDQVMQPQNADETYLIGRLHNHRNNFVVPLNDSDRSLLYGLFDMLWNALHSDTPHLRGGLIASLLRFAMHQISQAEAHTQTDRQSRSAEVVNRFLHLVNDHCHEHRDLDYYAEQLCMSKAHLSSLVSEGSPRTAREWIEQATIACIKVMLRHSSLSLADIARQMSFAEPSHFSRYFKRLAGMTPMEYRTQIP